MPGAVDRGKFGPMQMLDMLAKHLRDKGYRIYYMWAGAMQISQIALKFDSHTLSDFIDICIDEDTCTLRAELRNPPGRSRTATLEVSLYDPDSIPHLEWWIEETLLEY